jgi:hypothetical protein
MEVAVMKKDTKAWAIKLRGRNFRSHNGIPLLYMKRVDALAIAMRVEKTSGVIAQPIRVRVRIEEIA